MGLGSGDATARQRSLLRFEATGAPRRRLFCAPFAGGGPAIYRQWPRDLPDDVEVLGVQLPGRGPASREPLLDSVSEIVAVLLPVVQDAADLPFAFFGHSMGALIAFELTIALEQAGGPSPQHLFVSGRRSPDAPGRAPMIHALADEAFLDALDDGFGGVPDVVRREPELLALLMPALRADVRTFETYAPLTDRKVRCPVHVYGGSDDIHPRPSELAGWHRVAERDISLRLFPGDHFYLTASRTALIADIAGRWADAPVRAGRE